MFLLAVRVWEGGLGVGLRRTLMNTKTLINDFHRFHSVARIFRGLARGFADGFRGPNVVQVLYLYK